MPMATSSGACSLTGARLLSLSCAKASHPLSCVKLASNRLTQPGFDLRPVRPAQGQLGPVLEDHGKIAMGQRAKLAHARGIDGGRTMDAHEPPLIEALQQLG